MARVVLLEMVRKKGFYVLLILMAVLLLALLGIDVFGVKGAVGYVMDLGLLLVWLFAWILTTNLASRQLGQEEKTGTIYPLLAKPITRLELVAGKWLGAWLSGLAVAACFYVVVLAAVALRGGGFETWPLVQTMFLHGALLGIVAALSLALSTRLHADAAGTLSYIAAAFCFLVLPRFPSLIMEAEEPSRSVMLFLYHGLPHLELFDLRQRLVFGWGAVETPVLLQVSAYGVLWTALFLALAWLGYRRKRFRRGEAM
jgi:ABC-type transport system involved in multi-copper enzyme maturation permease subunit